MVFDLRDTIFKEVTMILCFNIFLTLYEERRELFEYYKILNEYFRAKK